MECSDIVMERLPSHDVEQFGSRDGSDIENQPPIFQDIHSPSKYGRELNYRKACQILCQAAMKDEWSIAEPILNRDPSFVRRRISKKGKTMLHLAAVARSIRFLQELIKLMEAGDLEVLDRDGNTAFLDAAATGMVEIAKEMRERNNNLPNNRGESGMLPILVAALYGVFSLIRQLGGIKNTTVQMFDSDGNNILHLAGKLGKPHHKQETRQSTPNVIPQLFEGPRYITETETESLETKEKIMLPSFLKISGAALQMQRERLWFKEVEKLVPSSLHKVRNNDGKTPSELFTEEHKVLLKEGEIWMKDTANSCMIAATMVFAAGFTLPGGNNSDNGIPVLLKVNGFTIFVISDAVALFSSIVSIIMFLSILTSRYAEDDFLVSLPVKLLFGLETLFVSIISMLLAFAATFFLVYTDHTDWEPNLIAAFVGVPVALFGSLQYKLLFDVVKSIGSAKFLFRPGNQSLF